MKARRVVLMAVALLLVAGCSDDVSTGPRPEAAVVPVNPGFVIDPDADIHQFQAGGDSWTIAVSSAGDGSVTRTSIMRNGAGFVDYEGYVAAGTSGAVTAQVYDASELAYANDLAVIREPDLMNLMALDFPCQAELEAFAFAGGILAWRVNTLRNAPSSKNRLAVAGAAATFIGAAFKLYECLNAARQQQGL